MTFSKPVNQLIPSRISCRTYEPSPISVEIVEKLQLFIDQQNACVKSKMRFVLTSMVDHQKKDQIKFGSYGAISGARDFIVSIFDDKEGDSRELGYVFESIILKATDLGLGTCWLGGTFNRKDFEKKFALSATESIPIVSPVGLSKDHRSLIDSAMRFTGGLDHRKAWQELFFEADEQHPLSKAQAGQYAEALEMVRIGPSASNKQPWRIIKVNQVFHFFLSRNVGYASMMKYDLQMNDIGIAQCHFEYSALSTGCQGEWKHLEDHPQPNNLEYCISWLSI